MSGYGRHSHFQHLAPLTSSTCDPSTSLGRWWGLHLLHRAEREACEPLEESGLSLLTLSLALRRPCSLHLEPCTWAQSQHRDAQVFRVTTVHVWGLQAALESSQFMCQPQAGATLWMIQPPGSGSFFGLRPWSLWGWNKAPHSALPVLPTHRSHE